MIEVKLIDKMPNDILEIVKELRSLGYIQGKDFDFQYRPPKYTDLTHDPVYNRTTTFMFYKEEMASWFSLRYL